MNKQQLANKIWESANKMRSKIEANEYKDYILGFIFSFITTYFATKWFINIIKKKKLIYFSIYCFIVGLLVLIFM